jgi:hypothetical protein
MSGVRVSQAQLARLRASLSGRDLEIMETVRRFRLVGARQVERLHFRDGNASALTQARTARRVLERLTTHHLLRRLDRRVGGVRAGSASYLYALGHVGHRLLSDGEPRRRPMEPSSFFADHTLAVTDAFVRLIEAERGQRLDLLAAEAEPECWRLFTSNTGGPLVLKPDLFVVLGVGAYEHRWFVEVDRGTEHGPAVRRKAETYLAYLGSGVEQGRHDVFPRVIWAAPDERRAYALSQALRGLPAPDHLFTTTTDEQLIDILSGAAA